MSVMAWWSGYRYGWVMVSEPWRAIFRRMWTGTPAVAGLLIGDQGDP